MRVPPLHDRVVLVTGAGRGIGRSVATAAASEGAHVAVAYHSSEAEARELAAEIRALGRDADAHPCDVADRDAVFALVAWAERRFGRIDGLVNNAGIMPETPFLDLTPEDWDLVMRTDLYGMFHASQAVLPGMLARGEGVIVNIASRLGMIGWPGVAHYASAKAGAMALAKSISREFGQRGIRANCVAPGVTNTAMGRTVMEGEVGRKRMRELPLGRFGEPDEVADCVTFLLSDASSLLLGQTLHPNSGGLMP
ncbi:SDR family NAD(P)-dependent oxidoreductase [Spirillospora sp. CA-294931]|uniref:SDR family NAD(P)-dependent oxidoreductase n=1 Tax=Spirillospora sp. CA-294931 TaxID=3240042 RepID=UPI003D908DE2